MIGYSWSHNWLLVLALFVGLGLSEEYRLGLANGMVAFEMRVNDLQYKEKLSQNKTPKERGQIIDSLSDSAHGSDQMIAEYMQMNED